MSSHGIKFHFITIFVTFFIRVETEAPPARGIRQELRQNPRQGLSDGKYQISATSEAPVPCRGPCLTEDFHFGELGYQRVLCKFWLKGALNPLLELFPNLHSIYLQIFTRIWSYRNYVRATDISSTLVLTGASACNRGITGASSPAIVLCNLCAEAPAPAGGQKLASVSTLFFITFFITSFSCESGPPLMTAEFCFFDDIRGSGVPWVPPRHGWPEF